MHDEKKKQELKTKEKTEAKAKLKTTNRISMITFAGPSTTSTSKQKSSDKK